MTDDFDLASLFEGLDPNQAQKLTERLRQVVKTEVETFRKQPAASEIDAQEQAEIDALKASGERGTNYATGMDQIRRKYTVLRMEQDRQPVTDPEIEKIGNDPRALYNLYVSRLKTIRRGDVRAVSELKAQFRRKGLQV